MRYKEGEIPPEMMAVNASNDMLLLTSVLGVLIGIALTIMGRKGKQMWMYVWGIGLVICSIYLGVSIGFGWNLFGKF
ncbi:hypothetical protein [Arenicella xantha]|uniref:Uncharacterized protein n=1 Tax=Arenicella xantha TaxID=644221 RepID=A0A395JS67_9GAMM|nr:hypothetical protein [Arenicella xantha]RBP53425.1 hypothetical protein DFR28_101811 [Arenicella xantha]